MLKLRELREQRGNTQVEIAKQLEISPQSYNNYESGKREPDYNTLIRFAKFFNVSVDYLIGNDNLITPDGLTEDELEIVNKIRKLDKKAQADVERYLNFQEYIKGSTKGG